MLSCFRSVLNASHRVLDHYNGGANVLSGTNDFRLDATDSRLIFFDKGLSFGLQSPLSVAAFSKRRSTPLERSGQVRNRTRGNAR